MALKKRLLTKLVLGTIGLGGLLTTEAAEIALNCVADASILSEADLSKPAGNLLTGRTKGTANPNLGSTPAGVRRALLKFDLSTLPTNAVIESAVLRLSVSKRGPESSFAPVSSWVHRLTAEWTEGSVFFFNENGQGMEPEDEHVTWNYRSYPDLMWTRPGGDYVLRASAEAQVPAVLEPFQEYASAGLAADVQHWLENPQSNFGWIIITDEAEEKMGYIVHYADRETKLDENKPTLIVQYTEGSDDPTYGGYPILNAAGDVNTGELIGWINTAQRPWIYSYEMGKYVYMEEAWIGSGSALMALPLEMGVEITGTHWRGYEKANAAGDVDATGSLGQWLNVATDPWLYGYQRGQWVLLLSTGDGSGFTWLYWMSK